METQTQLLLQCKEHHCPDNNLPHGEGQGIFVPSSSEEVQKPVKRPTRQRVAWTHEEESLSLLCDKLGSCGFATRKEISLLLLQPSGLLNFHAPQMLMRF